MGVEEVSQRQCCLLTAAILLAAGIDAKLPALRCINPIEADALAVDFDCVAINHRGDADERTSDS